ncbi:MAG: CHAT domain-containing protein [Fimbriimonadaceae bacterium]|nr:CHAT domain-containing protein [Fimbriimonadaceae bacterium]
MRTRQRWIVVVGLLVSSVTAAPRPGTEREEPWPAVDPQRPATTLAEFAEAAGRLSGWRVNPQLLEARAGATRDPREAARLQLALALTELVRGNKAGVKRAAGEAWQRTERTWPDAAALAALTLHLASDPAAASGPKSPLDAAAEWYRQSGNQEGQRVTAALLARQLAGSLPRTCETAVVERLAGRLEATVRPLETASGTPLADLQAAWAAGLLAERLGECGEPGEAAMLAWQARAEKLAARAAAQAGAQTLVRLAALNLQAKAQLAPLVHRHATALSNTDVERFGRYDAAVNAALLETTDAPTLLIGTLGLLENLDLWTKVLSQTARPNTTVLATYGRRLLLLTQAVLPLAESPPRGLPAAERLAGLPSKGGPQEFGMAACRLLSQTLGNVAPDETAEQGSYQEYAFWFYEQTKATQLARMLAVLRGEADFSATALQRRGQLGEERGDLAVKLLHGTARRVLEMRAAGEVPGPGPQRGGRPVNPRGTVVRPTAVGGGSGHRGPDAATAGLLARYQQIRREQLVLDLGNDDEARRTADLLERRITTAEVQRLLPDKQTALVAFGHDWAFVVTAAGLTWHSLRPLGPPRQTAEQAGRLGDPRLPESDRVRLAEQLHERYVAPLAGALTGVDHLLLMADGPLACLPFEALVTARGGDRWASCRFLGDRCSIDYVPSLTGLLLARDRGSRLPRQTPREALAVGDVKLGEAVQLGEDGSRFVLVPVRGGNDDELLKLPYTGAEARAVVAALGGPQRSTLLLGEQANEAAVRSQIGQHRVLHFATHGVLPESGDLLGAGLLLSPDRQGQVGLLTARDVYGLRLPARLAVLSACDTARGKMRFVSGGATSLAGAFLHSGVLNVVASLWPVDDQATASFMGYFYQQDLQRPGQEAAALTAAKQQMRAAEGGKWADPYYWAAFLMFR